MLTIRQGIISFLAQFLKQQLILNHCHYKQLCSIVLITKRNGSRSRLFFSTHIINLLETGPRLEMEAVIWGIVSCICETYFNVRQILLSPLAVPRLTGQNREEAAFRRKHADE